MLQSRNCIRLGQVLMDENRHFFMLCNNCHTDIKNMPEFRRHLEKCEGLEDIFREGQTLKYNTDKSTQLFGKSAKGIKEFLIYDYTDVDAQLSETEKNFIDLINIEEELLDPKWYSDLSPEEDSANIAHKSSKQYDVLVEEVTPFVQFKENVKSNAHIAIKAIPEVSVINTTASNVISAKKNLSQTKAKPTTKRKLSVTNVKNEYPLPPLPRSTIAVDLQKSPASFQGENSCQIPQLKRCKTQNGIPKTLTVAPISTRTLSLSKSKQASVAVAPVHSNDVPINPLVNTTQIAVNQNYQPAKEKQTAQILNKLQNRGLLIKRTQPFPTPNLETSKKTDDKTLEILLKLQSKGMKVKVLNKQSARAAINNDLNFPPVMSVNFGHTNTSEANVTVKPNVNRNLIIRKVN